MSTQVIASKTNIIETSTRYITPYTGGHCYILDSRPIGGTASTFETVHDQKNKSMEQLFREYTDYEVHNVTFRAGSKPEAVLKWFADELEERRKKKEIAIFYFHGGAGGNGEDYTW